MTSPAREKKFCIWDTYWNADRIHSFGVEPVSEISATFERYWAGIVARLAPGATVLDVGCGNGAAALAIKRRADAVGGTLAITAIDEAAIDPPRYVPEFADDLRSIDFRPQTLMEELPFENETFDAVVSQYGFEFGNSQRALAEAARVLKPNGVLSILALPAISTAVQAAGKALKQARYLLHDADLFEDALRIIQAYHEGPAETREQKMRSDLEQFNAQVEKAMVRFDANEISVVSAMITCLNDVFIDRKSQPLGAQIMAIQTARTRLAHYAARNQATTKAALGDGKLDVFRTTMLKSGFKITDTRSLFVQGTGVFAIQLTGERGALPA